MSRRPATRQLNAGKLSGFDLRENVSTQSLRIIYAGGKTYVQLPAALRKSTKPYSLVSANSTNPTIQAFAKTLGSTLSSSSLSSYAALVQAASSVRSRGQHVRRRPVGHATTRSS